ncbi:4'-phosphopantetheinyl transferase superfamily protein [Chitinophaga filiformis]|uniref:4'-phosphopantetheinyl transferase family protein n=1 Tax=Chitinophaga filiformis TaxID=104663 RepID=UPI001F1B1521|nr:4'-phosphopantetheinyl transferase superfamily protein [Chitinophaga filiformis]MCF6407865.1 4'-phosphopantetheinyl transferase superfamily protein [Chitinophaga filiformis]
MIGNDVIDLHLARQESNWQRKGYLSKIFTAAEQDMICQASMPSDMVWLLWSCKEAAYKIVNRLTNVRTYNPAKFSCTLSGNKEGTACGSVSYEARDYPFISYRHDSCIHTVAVSHNIFLDHFEIYTGSSLPVHLFSDKCLMKNQDGVPYLVNCCTYSPVPVSISHHGNYVGWVQKKVIF